jgi:hypothetical protein
MRHHGHVIHLPRRGRGRSKHGDERRRREFEFSAHDDITMGSPLSGKELAGLAPALLIAKNSPAAGESLRRDIIVMERTMPRTDCDTCAFAALSTRAFATAVHPRR